MWDRNWFIMYLLLHFFIFSVCLPSREICGRYFVHYLITCLHLFYEKASTLQYKNGISYIIKHILYHKIFFISFLEWNLCRFKQKWNMLYFVSSNFSHNLHLFLSNDNFVVFLLLTIHYLYNSILKIRFKKGSLKFNKFPNIYR